MNWSVAELDEINKAIVYISVLLNNHAKEAIDDFEMELEKLEEVMECYYISANSDLMLKIHCNDIDDFHNFITYKFSTIKNIKQFYSSFVITESEVKRHFKF